MTRLPAIDPDDARDPVAAEVFATSRAEGRTPILLYRVLANSPVLLRAYAGLARALRYDAQTPRGLRELVILRVAQLVKSDYEWAHHRAMAAAAGVEDAKVRELAAWRESERFDAAERAVLRAAEEIHAIDLSDDAYAELEAALGVAASVEIIMLVGFYECVARMIQALGLEVEPDHEAWLGMPAEPGDPAP